MELLSALIGAIVGSVMTGIVTWVIWWKNEQLRAEADLLTEALSIQAQREAYILDGSNYQEAKLSALEGSIPIQEPKDKGLWLRKVEIRSIMDVAWNTPPGKPFAFIEGRRTWIVRDEVTSIDASSEDIKFGISPHPAIITSKGMEELVGWIERVANACEYSPFPRITINALKTLDSLLWFVSMKEVAEVINGRLTKRAMKFLNRYGTMYVKRETNYAHIQWKTKVSSSN